MCKSLNKEELEEKIKDNINLFLKDNKIFPFYIRMEYKMKDKCVKEIIKIHIEEQN